eukprot:TRINITY_DN5077_c0_g1_i4.p1 TRINITY_DN5077_c0_g1~~TRINITY_DN5077_c0_g1_i4.p1  ORF type:complete len:311 (+),score=77.70 TRINITY_DN5077_c0_g1_i4:85-1017(+)
MDTLPACDMKCSAFDDAADACSTTGTDDTVAEITTIMLRNMPSRCRRAALVEIINEHGFKGTYDFLHHPMKRNKVQNYGYAVINFKEQATASHFLEVFDGYQLKGTSGKRLSATAAKDQGLEKNKFRFGWRSGGIDDDSESGSDNGGAVETPTAQGQLAQGSPGFVSLAHLHMGLKDVEDVDARGCSRLSASTASTRNQDSDPEGGSSEYSGASRKQQYPRIKNAPMPPPRARPQLHASIQSPVAATSHAEAVRFQPLGGAQPMQAFPSPVNAMLVMVPVPVQAVPAPFSCAYKFPPIDRSVYLNQHYED